jgi:hypothetical protein
LVTAVDEAVAAGQPVPKRCTRQEIREMSRVAAMLRRHAHRLPEDSALRGELVETAEYYLAVAEEARRGTSAGAA